MVLVFSYGSNSTSQLCARVENSCLKARPARALNWQRIFCMFGERWPSAAASLSPKEGAVVYGATVDLSAEELARLDKFETGYDQQTIEVNIQEEGGWSESKTAVVYISRNSKWEGPPSEQYLTAIHVMLMEQFQCEYYAGEIDVCGKLMGDAVVWLYTWKYPGSSCLSLPALCVEVNARRSRKWVMPLTIHQVVAELKELGIHSPAQLGVWLVGQGVGRENSDALQALLPDECSALDVEALVLFRELLAV